MLRVEEWCLIIMQPHQKSVQKRWPKQQFGGLNSWLEFPDRIQRCDISVLTDQYRTGKITRT